MYFSFRIRERFSNFNCLYLSLKQIKLIEIRSVGIDTVLPTTKLLNTLIVGSDRAIPIVPTLLKTDYVGFQLYFKSPLM